MLSLIRLNLDGFRFSTGYHFGVAHDARSPHHVRDNGET